MTVKELAQKTISGMPEEAIFEDIQYELYVLECIEQGEKDIASGNILTDELVRTRLQKWLK